MSKFHSQKLTGATGGTALVAMLHRHGVRTLFGLPGYQNDALYNALYDARGGAGEIKVVHTRHEQGAAYMAYGYARATGKPGVCAVVPGPGMLNATAALSTAYSASTPMLLISGQIPSRDIGRGFGHLHEIPDSLAVLRSLTKWSARAESIADIPALVDEAFRQMHTGRPRPVALEVPIDVLAGTGDATLGGPPDSYPVAQPASGTIAEAARLLLAARTPLIMIGSGADDAGADLLALAEALQAPVSAVTSGRGVIDSRHPLSLNGPAGHAIWKDADVVLAIGTRMQTPLDYWGTDDKLKVIRVDIDAEEITRFHTPALSIQADAGATIRALRDAVLAAKPERRSRTAELTQLKERVEEDMARVQPQYDILQSIRATLPENGIFVEDLTQVGYSSRYILPQYQTRAHITSNYQGTLGYGFAAALGAKVAQPERPVLCVNGDGGFMYNVQELATAVQHQIGLVTIVFDDGAFGNVQRMQREDHGGRVIATELRNPDFVAMARAYGADAERISDIAALAPALTRAFARKGPTLLHMPVGIMSSPWELVMMSRVRG
jgi:acetolactate synthase I/II/III large subunit